MRADMSTTGWDLVVVGSGIVGLGHALAAADRGLRVAVIDAASDIVGASIRNFGHVGTSVQTGLARDFAERAREIWLRLRTEVGIDVAEYGTWIPARAADEMAVLEHLAATDDARLLSRDEVARVSPITGAIGGVHLPRDLQVDPRVAAPRLAGHLAGRGIRFLMREAVVRVEPGRVLTSRREIEADAVVVATGHDVDRLFPFLAERRNVRRCGLDMLRVSAPLSRPLPGPVLTAWSMLRYPALAEAPATEALRERLHSERPDMAALDVNQMYTQAADGSLLVGDTHYRGTVIAPFQNELAFDVLLDEAATLFGLSERPRVIERWQGVYAQGDEPFLVETPGDGIRVVSVTSGIGMTTGLGLAERVIDDLIDAAGDPLGRLDRIVTKGES